MITDIERALNDRCITQTIIEYRTKDYWVFRDQEEKSLLFMPTKKSFDGLVACYKAAYQFGYNGIDSDKWDSFEIKQMVDNQEKMQYPCVYMYPGNKIVGTHE